MIWKSAPAWYDLRVEVLVWLSVSGRGTPVTSSKVSGQVLRTILLREGVPSPQGALALILAAADLVQRSFDLVCGSGGKLEFGIDDARRGGSAAGRDTGVWRNGSSHGGRGVAGTPSRGVRHLGEEQKIVRRRGGRPGLSERPETEPGNREVGRASACVSGRPSYMAADMGGKRSWCDSSDGRRRDGSRTGKSSRAACAAPRPRRPRPGRGCASRVVLVPLARNRGS